MTDSRFVHCPTCGWLASAGHSPGCISAAANSQPTLTASHSESSPLCVHGQKEHDFCAECSNARVFVAAPPLASLGRESSPEVLTADSVAIFQCAVKTVIRVGGPDQTIPCDQLHRLCVSHEALRALLSEREAAPTKAYYDNPVMIDGFPRSHRVDHWTPAEKAINDALQVVESVGADVLLTDAVILLGDAQRKVAEYVDRQIQADERVPCATCRHARSAHMREAYDGDEVWACVGRTACECQQFVAAASSPSPVPEEEPAQRIASDEARKILENYEMVACNLDTLGAGELADAERLALGFVAGLEAEISRLRAENAR